MWSGCLTTQIITLWLYCLLMQPLPNCPSVFQVRTCRQDLFPSLWLSMYVLSHVWLFATSWTVAGQASLPMEFSRQEYWSGLPFPFLQGIFLTQGSNLRLLCLLHWLADSLPLCHLGSPLIMIHVLKNHIGIKKFPKNFIIHISRFGAQLRQEWQLASVVLQERWCSCERKSIILALASKIMYDEVLGKLLYANVIFQNMYHN